MKRLYFILPLVMLAALALIICAVLTSDARHAWDEGTVVVAPTCAEGGTILYSCGECGTQKTATVPPTNLHEWGAYSHDTLSHTRICQVCGTVDTQEHALSYDAATNDYLCACGYAYYREAAYRITFLTDEHVKVLLSPTQSWTDGGTEANIAYSLSGKKGEPLLDGEGQVNFALSFDIGYRLSGITITEGYKNLKEIDDATTRSTYRITKITQDLTVTVTSKVEEGVYNLSSQTSDNGEIAFSWLSSPFVEYLDIAVTRADSPDAAQTFRIAGDVQSWQYAMEENIRYQFTFTPYNGSDAVLDSAVSVSRFYAPAAQEVGMTRVEITTEGSLWPSCEYVTAPSGCWGFAITQNDYVGCAVNLYDAAGQLLYSSVGQTDGSPDSGAKIKIRGNTSAYSEKTPYKLKLTEAADLLSQLVDGRDDGKVYSDRDWLLLAGGDSINTLIGWSASETLGLDWTPAYTYVSLYVNGDWRGLYILCESVKAGNGEGDTQSRVPINEDGFLIECDAYWWNEDLYFTTPITASTPAHFTFTYPDPDTLTEDSEAYQYIQEYLTAFEEALLAQDDSYTAYIDVASFAKWLLVHDMLGNNDSGGSNLYLTKGDRTDGTLLTMGLVWDFDNILSRSTDTYARIHYEQWFYYTRLLTQDSFTECYLALFEEAKDQLLTDLEQQLDSRLDATAYDALLSFERARWNKGNLQDLAGQKENARNYLTEHLAWMAEQLETK